MIGATTMKIILEQVIEAIETADEIAMGHLYFSLPIFPVFYSIAFNSGSSIYSDIFSGHS
jgi:hypothetical protein